MLTKNERWQIISNILSKLSDKQFQYDVWVHGKYWDSIIDFGEAVNTLADYCFFEIIENDWGNEGLSDTLRGPLKLFAQDLLRYDDTNKSKLQVIEDIKFEEIRKQAKFLSDMISSEVGSVPK